MRRFLPLLASALSALVLAPAAFAGTPFTIGEGDEPHLLVDGDGAAHVTWADQVTEKVKYCKVVRGATACAAAPATLDMPADTEPSLPFLVRGTGSTLYVAMAHYVRGASYLWTSNDNGGTWTTAPLKIYSTPNTTDPTEPLLGPLAGEITFASVNSARQVWGARTDGSESANAADKSATPANPGGISSLSYDFAIARSDDNGLVAVANNLTNTYWWRLNPGDDPSDTSKWSASPTDLGRLDTSRIAGGPGGVYVWGVGGEHADGTRRVEVRKWTGSGFGAPAALERGNGYIGDITVGPSGAVGAIWRRNDEPNRVRFALSTNGGASWSVTSIAREEGVLPSMDVGLANDAKGFAVWEGRGTGSSNQQIRMATTDEVPEPPPATAPGPTPSTPTTTPAPTTTPRPSTPGTTSRRVSGAVPGARIDLQVPQGCIPFGRPFTATLTWKKQRRKGNLFVKVARADFSIGSQRLRIDRKAPFRQRLTIPNPQRGQTYRLRARAFIKVRRGRAPKKSITTTLRVCG